MARHGQDMLAAEYVLGTLSPADRERAGKLCAEDPSFADAVGAWEQRLAPLAQAAPEQAPPSTLWERIATAAGLEDGHEYAVSRDFARQIAALKQRLALWRVAAVAATSLAAVLVALWFASVLVTGEPAVEGERYVAMLRGSGGKMGFLVTVEPQKERLLIRSMAPAAPQSKSYELWLIKKDGSSPATLGVVPPGEFMTMPVPARFSDADLSAGAELAVSLEPRDGAPSGRSMGLVVFTGELVRQTP